jgi:hypothetical protein
MSYSKMMKWQKKHPKGTRQPVLFHTNSGFWPSRSYILNSYNPYSEACEIAGVKPWSVKKHYDASLSGGIFTYNTLEANVEWTKNHPEISVDLQK